jgi:hypothetical protein
MILPSSDGIVGLALQQATMVGCRPDVPNQPVVERRVEDGRRTPGAAAVENRTEGPGWR